MLPLMTFIIENKKYYFWGGGVVHVNQGRFKTKMKDIVFGGGEGM
jgi:hypothetical protein